MMVISASATHFAEELDDRILCCAGQADSGAKAHALAKVMAARISGPRRNAFVIAHHFPLPPIGRLRQALRRQRQQQKSKEADRGEPPARSRPASLLRREMHQIEKCHCKVLPLVVRAKPNGNMQKHKQST